LWKPYVEVEGGKDGLRYQAIGGPVLCQKYMDLILPRKLVSRVVFPTNGAGKTTLYFPLSSSLLGVSGGGSPFLNI
jgi:hypothetical protein